MLLDIVKKGSTDRSVTLRIIDSTDGTPETGVVFNSSGIDLWYRREGAAVVSITEATLASLTTAHTDGGFLHVSNGEYRLDLPDAAFATGANYVDVGGTVTGMIVIGGRVRLVDYDMEDATRLGLTALPNAAAEAAGGLYTRGSGAGQIAQDANGRVSVNVAAYGGTGGTFSGGRPSVDVNSIANNAITAASIATGAIDADAIADNAIDNGAIADGALTAAKLATGAITAAKFAAGAIDAAAIATDAIDSDALKADAITAIQSGLATTTQLNAIEADTQDIQNRIPAALVSGRMAADAVAISGSTTAADNVEANIGNLDATVSAKASQAAVDDLPTNAEFAARTLVAADYATAAALATTDAVADAIKLKTDLIPNEPAAVGSAMTLTTGERDSIAAALLDLANGVETSVTVRKALRAMAAVLAGDATGAGTAGEAYKAIGNSGTTRVTPNADENGNRSAVTLNL